MRPALLQATLRAVMVELKHACLSDEEALALLSGTCARGEARSLLDRAEGCEACELLLREAGRALERAVGDDDAEPSPVGRPYRAGEVIAGRYQVQKMIGRGGMGEVYEVLDSDLGERVALKTIRSGLAHRARTVAQFKREILLARRVSHPNVCRVFEFGRHVPAAGDSAAPPPSYFLTMELLAGQSLRELLQREGRMKWERVIAIGLQLSAGVAAIHGEGILHRDIKTSNLLMCADADAGKPPRAVLVDFGVACRIDVHGSGAVREPAAGTPDYMAPEQRSGAVIGPPADVYAIGVVLFELLSGRRPPRPDLADQPAPTAARGSSHSPSLSLRSYVADVPSEIDELVGRCLQHDAADRPQSAKAVYDALLAFGRRSELELQGLPAQPPRATKRAAHVAGLAATVIVAVALVIGWVHSAQRAPVSAKVDSKPGEPTYLNASGNSEELNAKQPQAQVVAERGPVQAPVKAIAEVAPLRSEQPPKASGQARARTARNAADPGPPNCSPPYYYDPQGFRVYRKECLGNERE